MEKINADSKEPKLKGLWMAFGICFLFNILTMSVLGYGAFYTYQIRNEIDTIKEVSYKYY